MEKKYLKISTVGYAANIVFSIFLSDDVIRTKGKRLAIISQVQREIRVHQGFTEYLLDGMGQVIGKLSLIHH